MEKLIYALGLGGVVSVTGNEEQWRDKFAAAPKVFVNTGKFPYFSLELGDMLVLEGKKNGRTNILTIKVLTETITLDSVEDRHAKGSQLVELAGDVARDHAEIISITATVKTPAGTFTDCVKTEETTTPEKGAKESKLYAPGIGIVQDGDLRLTQPHAPSK
jgi:hypothetical protein